MSYTFDNLILTSSKIEMHLLVFNLLIRFFYTKYYQKIEIIF